MKSKAKTRHLNDDSEDDIGSHDNSIDHASATPSDSLRRSSRKRAVPKTWVTRPKKETAGYWTTAEKEKLLLHLDDLNTRLLSKSHYLRLYRYPFPYIKKRIPSKSIAQIKCFMSMLEHRKASSVLTRMKQQSPLESWRELADKLTMLGNDDCCRQLIRVCSVMALESTEDKDDTTNATSTSADTGAVATRKRYRRPSTKTAAAMTTAAAVRAAQVLAATGRESAAAVAATATARAAGKTASTITAASTTTASVAEPVTAATATAATTILEASTTTTATATTPSTTAATAAAKALTTPSTTAATAAARTATTLSVASTTATAAEPPITAAASTTAAAASTTAAATSAVSTTAATAAPPFVDTTINKPTLVSMPDGRLMAIPNTPAASIVSISTTATTALNGISEADMPALIPDYASIYKYIGGIMQGNKKELGPLESMIVLDCLKMVEDHLKTRNNKNDKEFMQDRFFDIFQKFYLSIDQEDALDIKKEPDCLDPVTVSTLLPKSPIGGQAENENSPEEIEEMDTVQNGLVDAEMMNQSEEALSSGLENQSGDNLQGENENEGPQNRNLERRLSVEAHRERRLKLELGSLNPFNIPVQRLEIRKDK